MPKDNHQHHSYAPGPLPIAVLGEAERIACLRLIRSENVGPVTFRELINRFGGARNALDALPDLARRTRSGRPLAIFSQSRAEAELEAASRAGAIPLFTVEPGYPSALAHLAIPPPLIYVKGRVELLQAPMVAMVGARNGSAAGSRMTRLIASRLGEEGYVVVSGLARGIDTAAHQTAISTGTVAVLAGGVDHVYPPENDRLQAAIAEKGCLLSEMPPGFRPRGQDFPRRNRIISGVSLGVIVVEAAARSGSLITAQAAAEQGRLVMAVPGHPLDPRAIGPNRLIRDGATMVLSPEDVIVELRPLVHDSMSASGPFQEAGGPTRFPASRSSIGIDSGPATAEFASSGYSGEHLPSSESQAAPVARPSLVQPTELDFLEAVAAVLGPAPITVDEVSRASGLPVHVVSAALLELALSGRIEQHGAQLVSLKPQ